MPHRQPDRFKVDLLIAVGDVVDIVAVGDVIDIVTFQ
jgi:hypothetical protein